MMWIILLVFTFYIPSYDCVNYAVFNECKQIGFFQGCGSNLANEVNRICNGTYNERNWNQKKSIQGVNELNWLINDYNNLKELEEYFNYPFRSKTRIHAVQLPNEVKKRRATGIVDECCRKPCFCETLISYCSV